MRTKNDAFRVKMNEQYIYTGDVQTAYNLYRSETESDRPASLAIKDESRKTYYTMLTGANSDDTIGPDPETPKRSKTSSPGDQPAKK